MCSNFRGYRPILEFLGVGLKFGLKFKLIIPEIGTHTLAEGSGLTVPTPRRVQTFCKSGENIPCLWTID